MTKASRKWNLLYLHVTYNYGALEGRIINKEFDNELDLLVWASKNRIPKAVGQHWVSRPDGVGRLPTELYGRIEQLRKELIEEERKAEKPEPEHYFREKRKRGRPRKVEKLGEVRVT